MIHQITSKCELNVLSATTNVAYVNDLAIRYRVPAVVCSPEYVAPLLSQRASRGGGYQIICAVDFPYGKNFAMDKLKRSHPDFTMADGFEILVSVGRTEVETKNELKAIHEFVKMQNRLLQIRWCLSLHHKDQEAGVAALKGMKKFPPSYVRIDPHTTLKNLTMEARMEAVELVKEHVPYPIKVSGNVDIETITALENKVARFDLDVDGLKKLVASVDENEGRFLDMPVVGDESDPLDKLDGVRKAQAQRLVKSGLKVQKRSRLRG